MDLFSSFIFQIVTMSKVPSALPLAGSYPTKQCETNLFFHTHTLFAVIPIFSTCSMSLIISVTHYSLSVLDLFLCSERTGPTNPSHRPVFLRVSEHITLPYSNWNIFSALEVENWRKNYCE